MAVWLSYDSRGNEEDVWALQDVIGSCWDQEPYANQTKGPVLLDMVLDASVDSFLISADAR